MAPGGCAELGLTAADFLGVCSQLSLTAQPEQQDAPQDEGERDPTKTPVQLRNAPGSCAVTENEMDQMRLGLAKEQKIRHAGQNPAGLSQKPRRSRAKEFGSILDPCEIFSSDRMTSRRARQRVQVSV